MQTIRWTSLLALGMLAVPLASRAQTAPAQGPQPKITEIMTVSGSLVDEAIRMPNGRIVVYGAEDDQAGYIAAYDLTTKKTTIIAKGYYWGLAISAQGNRLAYWRPSSENRSFFVWTIPIDPATGSPTGPAQRLTTSSGSSPSFSPDGRSIAFATISPGDTSHTVLAVIPATGGTQRILARYDTRIRGTSWSADGRWIYVQTGWGLGEPTATTTTVERVPAAGGKSEALMSFPNSNMGSIDGQVGFHRTAAAIATGRVAYSTARGEQGEFSIPSGTFPGTTLGTPRPLLTQVVVPFVLYIRNQGDGNMQALPFQAVNARNATWSPDQKHLALAAGEGENQEIIVVNPDGSVLRRAKFKGGSSLGADGKVSWAPDGNTLAFTAGDGPEIRLLNVATGASRVLASPPAGTHFGGAGFWKPDGKSIVNTTGVSAGAIGTEWKLVEIRLDGTTRIVRDLSAEFPSARVAIVGSARHALLSLGDSLWPASGTTGFLVVPVEGGAAHTAPMPTLTQGEKLGVVMARSEKWFGALRINGTQRALQVMSTGTDSTRILSLPENFAVLFKSVPFLFSPDDRHVLVHGFVPGKPGMKNYLIPIDGTAQKVLPGYRPRGMTGFGSGLSPDGNLFAFFGESGTYTTHIYDIDLSPILNLIKKP